MSSKLLSLFLLLQVVMGTLLISYSWDVLFAVLGEIKAHTLHDLRKAFKQE